MKKEKEMARNSSQKIIIVDDSKIVTVLGDNDYRLPIEIDPKKQEEAIEEITNIMDFSHGDIGIEYLRKGKKGKLFITENGNRIIDIPFKGYEYDSERPGNRK